MSLFLADSRAPRSTMASSSRSYLTLCRTSSGRGAVSLDRTRTRVTTPATKTKSARPPARNFFPLLHPFDRGRREPPGAGEPFSAAGRGGTGAGCGSGSRCAGVGWLVAGGEAAVAVSDFIDPHSSRVDRHQLEVAVELEPDVEVVDPDRQEGVLGRRQGPLGRE